MAEIEHGRVPTAEFETLVSDKPVNLRDFFVDEVIDGKETGHKVISIKRRDDGYGYENVAGLKSGLASERGIKEGLQTTLAGLKDEDGKPLDPVQVAKDRKDYADLKARMTGDQKAADTKWQEKERTLTEEWQGKFDGQAKSITALSDENVFLRKTKDADDALRKARVRPEYSDLMRDHMLAGMRIKGEGKDKTTVMVDGKETEIPTMEPHSTASMGPMEYAMRVLREKYTANFNTLEDASGTGAPGGGKEDVGDAGTGEHLTITESEAKAHPEKYQTLWAKAQKEGKQLRIIEG